MPILSYKPDVSDHNLITQCHLQQIMPMAQPPLLSQFCDEFNKQLEVYGIDTPSSIAAFIAQGAFDTQELTELIETLNYSEITMLSLWPNGFHNTSKINAYSYNPEKLGNFLYANVHGNGNSHSGDGYKYRGRGWFKIIGRENYESFSNLFGIDFTTYPDLLGIPRYAVLSACMRWDELNLNSLADKEDIKTIFSKLNGRYNHTNSRMNYYYRALRILSEQPVYIPVPVPKRMPNKRP